MDAFGYAVLVLAALLAAAGVELAADLLNLRAQRRGMPAEMRGLVEPESFERARAYARAKTRFGVAARAYDLVLVLGFWAAGGFAWLDGALRSLGFGPIATGLLFVGGLAVGRSLLGLPFSWVHTFRLEERFGFNRTTPRTFWLDRAKGLLLGGLLGGPLLAAILWFFRATGDAAWLWCWAATSAFLLVVQLVAPTWIFPLFHRFEPLEEGELREAVLAYARKVGFPLEGLFVIDGSRRSTKANAFFTGFGRRKRVALYDTLIEKHGTDELVAIVAHEIGHYRRGHIWRGLVLGILQMGLVFLLLSLVLEADGLYAAFGVELSTYAGLVFFGLLWAPIDLVLSLGMQAFSRRNEYDADRFARDTTGSAETLARALEHLSTENLENPTPHPFYVLLHYSHPPLLARVAALRAG